MYWLVFIPNVSLVVPNSNSMYRVGSLLKSVPKRKWKLRTFPMVSTWKTEYDAWMVRYGQCTRTICYHINMANMKGLLVFFLNQLVWGEWIFCFSNSNGPASKINNNMKSKINFFLFYWLCQYLHNQKTPKWNKTKSWDDVTLLQYFFFLCESYHMLF